jgi:hypothetical protein
MAVANHNHSRMHAQTSSSLVGLVGALWAPRRRSPLHLPHNKMGDPSIRHLIAIVIMKGDPTFQQAIARFFFLFISFSFPRMSAEKKSVEHLY